MNIQKPVLLLSLCVILSGCFDGRVNTKKLCEKNPALRCDQLNMDDGQCKIPRTDLIWHRKTVLENPSDINKIKEFELVKAYNRCLDLAAQIEPIKLENKKERRFNALIHSVAEEKRLIEELRAYDTPEAYYFLWTQGEHGAIRKFLSLEGTGKLQTPELQYALATYYISRDKEKTVQILSNALGMSDPDKININIFQSLASANHTLNRKQHAYIWVLVGKEFDVPVASERELTVLYDFTDSEKEQLEEIADTVVSAIKKGKFHPGLLPKVKD